MPTFVKATKYKEAHWRKQETEYRVTFYEPSQNGGWDGDCDHFDDKSDAIEAAKQHETDTGFPAVVERLVWHSYSYTPDVEDSWLPVDGMDGPEEFWVYGEFPSDGDPQP